MHNKFLLKKKGSLKGKKIGANSFFILYTSLHKGSTTILKVLSSHESVSIPFIKNMVVIRGWLLLKGTAPGGFSVLKRHARNNRDGAVS